MKRFLLGSFLALGLLSAVPVLADEASTIRRLMSIEEKQKKILDALEEIKAELVAIKMRVTR